MAALKLLNNKSSFSLSQGFRNYFYCCFPSSDTNDSPTRSTVVVLKADELGKNLSDEDDSSLVRRRSLIADNFGYESDPSRQLGTNQSNASREMTLENCKPSTLSSEASEKSRIVDHVSGAQRHDSSTLAVKKGLDSLLVIAEQATNELNADKNQTCEIEEPDNRSGNSNPDGVENISDDLQPILEGAGVKGTIVTEDAKASSTVSSVTEENKKLSSTDDSNAAGAGGSVQNPDDSNAAVSASSVVVAATGGAAKNANLEIVDGADGHLFDISDLQQNNSAGSSVVSSCGSVLVALSHDSHVNRMSINVKEARDLPSRERGGVNQAQIRTLLLPLRKVRHKTKVVVANESTSLFNETFECKVPTDQLTSMGLRVRLYGCERLRKDRLIGETIINFTQSNTNGEHFWAHLEPRSNLSHGDSLNSISSLTHSESDSSTHSLQHGGTLELMLGLAYNGVTGRLSVEVIKGSNFKNAATKRPPDTFVRMELKGPDGERITHSKTTIRRGHPNPLFKETFMFQVAQSQLNDVSLHVSVFVQKSLKRKEMIGWFTMGSTNSSDDDGAHWTSMLESKGEQVCKWHALLEP